MVNERVPLYEIAYARSGDKGGNANIGLIAYTRSGFEFLREAVTEQVVHDYFSLLGVQETIRYELPSLLAFNFVLKGALGSGASSSLRIDAQGKALGQALLEMQVTISEELLNRSRRTQRLS